MADRYLSRIPGIYPSALDSVYRGIPINYMVVNVKENKKMWTFWFDLTPDQKRQARDLDSEVRKYPTEFEYFVDENGDVTGYERIIK